MILSDIEEILLKCSWGFSFFIFIVASIKLNNPFLVIGCVIGSILGWIFTKLYK